jgi:hypothetical protein
MNKYDARWHSVAGTVSSCMLGLISDNFRYVLLSLENNNNWNVTFYLENESELDVEFIHDYMVDMDCSDWYSDTWSYDIIMGSKVQFPLKDNERLLFMKRDDRSLVENSTLEELRNELAIHEENVKDQVHLTALDIYHYENAKSEIIKRETGVNASEELSKSPVTISVRNQPIKLPENYIEEVFGFKRPDR